MPGPYSRPSHGSAFNDGSATDATVLLAAMATSLEQVEGSVASAVPNATQARLNLGLGNASVLAQTDVLKTASNLSDLASPATARTNLGAVGNDPTGVPDTTGLWQPWLRWPKYPPATKVITMMQASPAHGFTGGGGFVNNDTTDFCMGMQSVKTVTAGTAATHDIHNYAVTSFDATGQSFRIRLKVENIAHVNTIGLTMSAEVGAPTSAYFQWTILASAIQTGSEILTEGDWVTVTLNFRDATVVGAPSRSAITNIRFTAKDDGGGAGSFVTLHVNSIETVPEPATAFPNGVVSICFDDGWDSTWSWAKGQLDYNNIRASHFVISDQIGQAGRNTQAQLLAMQNQGHEINAHCWTLADHVTGFTNMTAAQLDADMRQQAASLRGVGFRGQGTAYPQGLFGKTSDAQPTQPITARYFAYARTTQGTRGVETFPPADPYRLRARSGISTFAGGYAPSNIYTATTGDIDKAKANKAWLILVFHKIVVSGAAATTECNQADFTSILNQIVSSGVACLPIGDVLSYYG